MRTAEQMRATLQACHEAGDHSEALEVATDITVDAERRRDELAGESSRASACVASVVCGDGLTWNPFAG